MDADAAQDRREDMRTNCSCLVAIDPYDQLCPHCRKIRREREAEQRELIRDLYMGEG